MAQLLFTGSSLNGGSLTSVPNLELALQLVENRLAVWASNSETYNTLLRRVFATDKAPPGQLPPICKPACWRAASKFP